MTPIPEVINKPVFNSFAVRKFTSPCSENIFHFHEEYEITYVIDAKGERFVGGKLERFYPGDLVLIGKNTPHYYIHDSDTQDKKSAPVIVVHFSDAFLGQALSDIPEFQSLSKLLDKAKAGISFSKEIADQVSLLLVRMQEEKGLDRLITLLQVFRLLLSDKEHRLIGNLGFDGQISQKDQNRISSIYSYISNHYQEKISLDQMADLVHMTPPAFCRFFKRMTRKSFVQYLNEYRIGNACRLLSNTDLPISEIAFTCGFSNLANFNRKFKAETSFTPLNYRSKFSLSR